MNAYTQRIGFDVLTAPLAEVDRRGLSQAWYSALHLAHDAPRLVAEQRARRDEAGGTPSVDPPEAAKNSLQASAPARRAVDREPAHVRYASERRALPTPLARKIERALLGRKRPERFSTFVLDGRRRVHVAMRATGTKIHVVAVCAPQSSARVARALEEARYALARRGIALDARMRECVR